MSQGAPLFFQCRGFAKQDNGNICLYLFIFSYLVEVNMEQVSAYLVFLDFADEDTSGLLVGIDVKAKEPGCSGPGNNMLKFSSITLQ